MKLICCTFLALIVGCSSGISESEVSHSSDDSASNVSPVAAPLSQAYECNETGTRQGAESLPTDAKIKFDYRVADGRATLSNLMGFVTLNYDFNVGEFEIKNYLGVFTGDFKNRESYNARVYTNHYKFEDFDAKLTSDTDGGGMFGYLVVNKNIGEDKIDAHYVFQAGDHMGGTVDMVCRTR